MHGRRAMTGNRRINRREILGGATAAGLAAALDQAHAQAPPPKPKVLTVNASGGAMGQAMKDSYVALFEQRTGIPVTLTSPNDLGKLKAMVESGNVEWNVTEINSADARRAARSAGADRRQNRRPFQLSCPSARQVPAHDLGLLDADGVSHRRVQGRSAADVDRLLGRQEVSWS